MARVWRCLLFICASALWVHGQASGADSASGVVDHGRLFPISAESISQAAASFSPAVKWSQGIVTLRPELGTRSANAPLRVTGTRRARDPNGVLLRTECRDVHDCAPFWAEMIFPEPLESLQTKARASSPAFNPTPRPRPLVGPGRPASLLFNQNGLKISMRVMPLKRAALGETVAVLDLETRRKFLARVEGVDLLGSDLREAK